MAENLQCEFEAELWRWEARRDDWYFVTLPAAFSADIREFAGDLPRGFGAVRVEAIVGASRWRTSVFPEAALAAYVLPIKRAVRQASDIAVGDPVKVHVTVLP